MIKLNQRLFLYIATESGNPTQSRFVQHENHRRQKAERRRSGAFCRQSEFALLGIIH